MTLSSPWKQAICTAALLGAFCGTAAAADPLVSIVAAPTPAVLGSPLVLDVQIAGALDLYGFQFTLSFDPNLLQATGVTEGSFLADAGPTSFGVGGINNATGTVSFIFDSLLGATPGVSGNGLLASIGFNTMQVGVSGLSFSNALFLDSNLNTLLVQLQNASLQVVPEPSALVLFALGMVGLAGLRLKRG